MGKESENPVGAIQQSAGDQEKQQPFYLYYNFRRKKTDRQEAADLF